MKKSETFILADWGNTNLRFYLCQGGQELDKREMKGGGIQQLRLYRRTDRVPAELYAETLAGQIPDWLSKYPDAPVLMGGVIGTREGWSVAPYFPCPVDINTLAHNLHQLKDDELGALRGREVFIVPGLKILHPGNRRYVVRGEEIKSFGAMDVLPPGQNLVAMPGTHCQWMQINAPKIERFATFMAGELYDILTKHGAIYSCIPAEEADDLPAFDRGLEIAAQGNDLLTDLHNVRSQRMTNDDPPASYHSYLSAIIIGHEILGAAKLFGRDMPLSLVMDPGHKQDLYQRAFEKYEWKVQHALPAEETFLKGLKQIHAAAIAPKPPAPSVLRSAGPHDLPQQ